MLQKAGVSFKVDNRLPNLVNLNEDPQLSEMLLYVIKEGTTVIGQQNPNSTHDIQLTGALVALDHWWGCMGVMLCCTVHVRILIRMLLNLCTYTVLCMDIRTYALLCMQYAPLTFMYCAIHTYVHTYIQTHESEMYPHVLTLMVSLL